VEGIAGGETRQDLGSRVGNILLSEKRRLRGGQVWSEA
jgi:hypothetical protein